MRTKSEILKDLYEWNSKLIKEMRKSSHHFDDDNLSPHHLEGDVWAHTMMTFGRSVNDARMDKPLSREEIAMAIASLSHDFGKPRMRGSHKENHINFFNHEQAGVQYAIDFIYFLKDKYNLDPDFVHYLLTFVLYSINYHLSIYDLREDQLTLIMNNNKSLFLIMADLLRADSLGQIKDYSHSAISGKKTKIYSELGVPLHKHVKNLKPIQQNSIPSLTECKFVIMSGIPGCGKDYIAKNLDNPIILSYDKIRLEEFLKHSPEYVKKNSDEHYKAAFKYCNKKKINLNNILQKQIKDAFDHPGQVIVANTNIYKKSRKPIINMIKQEIERDKKSRIKNNLFERDDSDYRIAALHVVCPLSTAHERDENRSNDKTVGKMVIGGFAYRVQLPTLLEGFDYVNIIQN